MPKELADSRAKVYLIPIRSITSNTNPRQALSKSLDTQGWTVFHGDKPLWPLATSNDPTELGMSKKTLDNRLKLLNLPPEQQKKIEAGKMTATKALAEKNGIPAKTATPMRTRKEVTAAMEEFPESRPERKVLEWMLGMREKIA